MLGEIDKNFYCSCLSYEKATENCHRFKHRDGGLRKCADVRNQSKSGRCDNYHRKFPTLEQFREEYGKDYANGVNREEAVYAFINFEWFAMPLMDAEDCFSADIVCACTPFGKPDKDWRP